MNIPIHPNSHRYFGSWAFLADGVEYFLVANVLVFGFSASPYVDQTLVEALCTFVRAWYIPAQVYLDETLAPETDRYDGETTGVILVLTFVCGGFFVSISKSFPLPRSIFTYLGIEVDLPRRMFIIPTPKRDSFLALLDTLLSGASSDLASLERLAGKCAHLSIVIPGALAFTRQMYLAITHARQSGSRFFTRSSLLQEELAEWLM
ncbi:hypothetical protein HDU76_007201, partial [Blyttiomyces sp. JEL0837]